MTETGQRRLTNARVVLMGISGWSSACATYLVSTGVGELLLVDNSRVAAEDLGDQPLLRSSDVGEFKSLAIANHLRGLDNDVNIQSLQKSLDSHNAEELISNSHVVVDGLADWQDKLLLSDVCMQTGKTLIHAGVRKFEFQIYTMIPGRSACLRCVFSKAGLEDIAAQSSLDSYAMLAPLAGMAGSFQAIETIKILSGLGPTPGNHLIKFDSLRRDFDDVTNLGPRPDCPDCGMRY